MERIAKLPSKALASEVSGASLAALRVAFGVLMAVAIARFAWMGWIDSLYVAPRVHLHYFGFGWVAPLPAPWIHVHFALMGLAAVLVALGLFYRVSIVVFTILFAWAELLDAATYLNHYYAITLIGLLLSFIPAHRAFSIDAWWATRRGLPWQSTVPWVWVALLRAQLGIVYFFAGVAKLDADWLFRAEPLRTWLTARSDLPLIGPLLGLEGTAFAMSWGGALFDLAIPFLLASPRTRGAAYGAVLVFHALTGWIFPSIGVFPYVMVALTPIFFAPAWPERFLPQVQPAAQVEFAPRPLSRPLLAVMAIHLALQVLLPVRHWAYPGDVLFTQEGVRWSWRVMVAERAAVAEMWTIDGAGRRTLIDLSQYLTPLQLRMASAEPDLLIQVAHWIAEEHRARGEAVEVHAEVWVAVNGHPARRLIDPAIDLAAEEESLFGHRWLASR